MDSVEKIYPTVEELSKLNKNLSCPECSAVFNSESNLNLHVTKTHKKANLAPSNPINKIYHCPITHCRYNESYHFKLYKLLKQHFLKVHSDKNYKCTQCNKGFATESFRDRHSEYCNVDFKCCDCDISYPCYETLKTHSRRKKHNILDKMAYKTGTSNETLKNPKSETIFSTVKLPRVLPKSSSLGMIVVLDTSEQSCQTDAKDIKRCSRETQTGGPRMPNFTVETQTIGDYFTRSSVFNNTVKSTKTQTGAANPKTVSCNTSFNSDDLEFEMGDIQRSSSSTQTNLYNTADYIYSSSTSTHDSIHTDTSDLLTDTFDSNFFNCNMETQTDQMFNDELFKCDYYTNMYTQTCEDLLLDDIGLNNTHTQTVFDEMLKSVESQTIMSKSKRLPLSCKDTSHMETQTDMEFKQMLEEINA